MTPEDQKKLNEVHEILSFFKKIYDSQIAGKEFSVATRSKRQRMP